MDQNVERELEGLGRMTTSELCDRYAQLHGQPVRTRHRQYLLRKIAWRIQALAEGDLDARLARLRGRAAELANDADIRLMPPRPRTAPPPPEYSQRPFDRHSGGGGRGPGGQRVAMVPNTGDLRLPSPGTTIVRDYRGRQLRVTVLQAGAGFEFEGERYKTLSAVAKKITGSHVNGYRFFRLTEEAR